MSVGSKHDETGIVGLEVGQLVLLRDEGGRWRLDAPIGAKRFLEHLSS